MNKKTAIFIPARMNSSRFPGKPLAPIEGIPMVIYCARNAIKTLKETTNKKDANKLFADVTSMLDKLSKNNIIHKNKSANLKSKLSKHVNTLKPVKKVTKPKTKSTSS